MVELIKQNGRDQGGGMEEARGGGKARECTWADLGTGG
jgi:hypothetical protein